MIVRHLELENIRSYRRASIDFPLGKTLFEGDIGSGKSTILMALEFALFGFGTESGASLLRVGSAEGKVTMTFSTDSGEYVVERGLVRKGRGVQQTNGALKTPEGDLDLSPSELKERVLEVLGFNEAPDPRAQSWIFRYAIYTPQEEMKAVLALAPDLRLQILRRAFGVEDYKTAAENSANLLREIRRKAGEYEVLGRGVQELQKKLAEIREQREADAGRAAAARQKQDAMTEQLRALKREKEELRERELQLRNSKETIKLLKEKIVDVQKSAEAEKATGKELAQRADALRRRLGEAKKPRPPSKLSPAVLEASAESARKRIERLTAMEARISSKLGEYRSILKKGKCPVCDRKVKARDFKDVAKKKRTERRHVVAELVQERSKEKDLRDQAKEMREYEQKVKEAKELELELKRCDADLSRSRQKMARAESEARAAGFRIERLERKLTMLTPFTKRAEEVAHRIEAAEERLAEHRDALSRVTEGMEQAAKREAEIGQEVSEKEKAAKLSETLQEYGLWLSDYFVPALRLIEKNVLWSLNQEFDSLFRRVYASLVEDPGKDARVDEVFTPIVTQDDYDQDVYYLSGGERTSVSLAYRLALNSLVQRITGKSSMLILDEPTDGFSREQMGSVREVLDEIGCQQVIVVSHERELESFADQVLRVVKENGESVVLGGAG